MNGKALTTQAANVFVAGVVQFFAGLAGPGAAIAAGAVIPFLCLGLQRFFELELDNPWWAVAPPALGSVVGVGLGVLGATGAADPLFWLAPACATAGAALIVWYQQRDTQRCPLCEGRIAGALTFACPRCHLAVCDNCWKHEKLRCRLCVQNAVPLLPDSKQWWDRNIGLTTKQGRCQVCQADQEQAELRACRKCGRPQCLECWDDANGVCARCHVRAGELPAEIERLLPAETRN